MYPKLFRVLRPFGPGGQELRKRQKELDQTQWFSHDELEALQLDKLKKLIEYAYEYVPYYHTLYKSLDIHPQDIKSLKDFRALPFLTREIVNNHQQELVTREPNHKLVSNATGGSTGEPMQFWVEKAFDRWDPALELRGRAWYGVGEGERIAFVWGAKRDIHDWSRRERLKAVIVQERYLNAFAMTDQKMQSFAEMLVRWKPTMFRAYPSALTLFAQYVHDHGISGIQPKFIEVTAEKVSATQRQLMEMVFGCKVADWYSSREFGTIAFQCPAGSLHVSETRYLELVANNQVVQPGEMGEVIITSLHQYGMPFIRYKLGDIAVAEPNPCSCGRGLQSLREVVGRLHDWLVTSEGGFVHGEFFAHTFRNCPEITRFQVYQPDIKHIEVRLLFRAKTDLILLENLRKEIQHRFGEGMQIELKLVDTFELTRAGKHRFIISDVKPDFVD